MVVVVASGAVVVVELVVLETADVDDGAVGRVVVGDTEEEHAAMSSASVMSTVVDGRGRMQEG